MARFRPDALLEEGKGGHPGFDDLSGDERQKNGQIAPEQGAEDRTSRDRVIKSRKEPRIKEKRRK